MYVFFGEGSNDVTSTEAKFILKQRKSYKYNGATTLRNES